jgi:hypothetical protein
MKDREPITFVYEVRHSFQTAHDFFIRQQMPATSKTDISRKSKEIEQCVSFPNPEKPKKKGPGNQPEPSNFKIETINP